MDKKKLQIDLLNLLKESIIENDVYIDDNLVINEQTRLIGNTSIFDSIELVQFIVEVEDMLEEKYEIEIQLTSEKAMSRRNSPFISISTLTKFITDETE